MEKCGDVELLKAFELARDLGRSEIRPRVLQRQEGGQKRRSVEHVSL